MPEIAMAGMAIDQHTLAWIGIAGVVLDILGGLYLAYDLLGGEHGPLRTLTRAVTYGLCFGIVYGVAFGPAFGLVAGMGFGSLLGLEFAHIATGTAGKGAGARWPVMLFGVLRGAVLGIAGGLTFGAAFGIVLGLLAALGLVVAYMMRFSPADVVVAAAPHIALKQDNTPVRPRWRWNAVRAAAARGLAIGLAAILAGIVTRGSVGVLLGLEIGLVVGLVGTIVSTVSPFVEWWADHLPERRLGAVGVAMLLLGLGLSSVPYWVTVFDISVR
jgi:hypothetical protein